MWWEDKLPISICNNYTTWQNFYKKVKKFNFSHFNSVSVQTISTSCSGLEFDFISHHQIRALEEAKSLFLDNQIDHPITWDIPLCWTFAKKILFT